MINRQLIQILPFIIFAIQGCTIADLRTPGIKQLQDGISLKVQADEIYSKVLERIDPVNKWGQFDHVEITATDEWRSMIFRLLTPVNEPRQKLRFQFALKTKDASMRYLTGPTKDQQIGLEVGRSFYMKGEDKIFKKDRKTQAYLAPVRDYFLLPVTLHSAATRLYVGKEINNGRVYHKIFVTDGDLSLRKDTDQYVLWVDETTQEIAMIEFTLRDLFKSYRGVIHYDDFKEVDGLSVPHVITLNEDYDKRKYSHRFIVDTWKFK